MQSLNNIQREIVYLDLEKILPNPYQTRKIFDEVSIDELSKSISKYGVLEPILVREVKGYFEIVSGERRLKACKKLGMIKIPSIIINITKKDSAYITIIENTQRETLNFIEEAEGFQTLMVYFGYTQEEIAKNIGKTENVVNSKLSILRLKKEIKETILQNKLTERHAVALLKLRNYSLQKEVLEKVIKYNLNAKKTEQLVENTIKRNAGISLKNGKKVKCYVSDLRIFTNTIKDAVNTMKCSGIDTNYSIVKNDNGYEIKIKIYE